MTFAQMYSLAESLWDKTGSPYLSPEQFDNIANVKYNDWAELEAKMFEKDENFMARLMFLYKTYTKNNSNTIDRVTDVPDFRRRVRFGATFLDPCTKKPNPYPTAIEPVTNDEIDVLTTDPFNSPTDDEPLCITTILPSGNPGFLVYSETTPLSLNMTYLKVPQTIDFTNNPNTVFEQPDYIAQEVVTLVVKNADYIVENYNRGKADQEEINQRAASQ